jgi:hypothetical protein
MKYVKMLALAAVAAMAISAVAASAAFANKYHDPIPSGNIHGEQLAGNKHVFKVDGQAVECSVATFQGTFETEIQQTERVLPTYENCVAFGFVGATVSMNGCEYEFLEPTEIAANEYEGVANLVCPAGKEAVIVAGTCETKIPDEKEEKAINQNLKKLTSHNRGEGTGRWVEVISNLSSITVNKTKDGFLCPLSGTGWVSNGTYTGGSKAWASNSAEEPVGFWIE